jgi:hypothetical protein
VYGSVGIAGSQLQAREGELQIEVGRHGRRLEDLGEVLDRFGAHLRRRTPGWQRSAVAPRGEDEAEHPMRLDVVGVDGQRLACGVHCFGRLVLPREEAGQFGVELGGFGVELEGALQCLLRRIRVALRLEPARQQEFEIRLSRGIGRRSSLLRRRLETSRQHQRDDHDDTHS